MKEPVRRLWEQALVLRCQAGDDHAFEELLVVFHDRLKNYIDRVLGNPGNAEDVLQEVWFDVYRKLPSLRSPKAIRSWLFRIVRNKNAHHFRRDRIQTEPLEVGTRKRGQNYFCLPSLPQIVLTPFALCYSSLSLVGPIAMNRSTIIPAENSLSISLGENGAFPPIPKSWRVRSQRRRAVSDIERHSGSTQSARGGGIGSCAKMFRKLRN